MSGPAPLGVAFMGGGTGGHVYPALAIAHALESLVPDAQAVFLTGDRPADAQAMDGATAFGAPVRRVALHARPPGLKPAAMLAFARRWPQAVADSRAALRDLKARCRCVLALSTGGYVSAPAVRAARLENLPVVLVALDARIGKANAWLARWAQARLLAQNAQHPQTHAPARWRPIGPIVGRHALPPGDAAHCRRLLGLEHDRPTLLVMGGSQGARSLNRLVLALLEHHHQALAGWQLIHLTGSDAQARATRQACHALGIPVYAAAACNPIGPAWGAASLALCRCGAGTVAEAHANAVPCVFAPYPYHRDQHQALNAQPLVLAGGAVLARDAIDPAANLRTLAGPLLELLASPDRRREMAAALHRLPRQDGADACARLLLELAARTPQPA